MKIIYLMVQHTKIFRLLPNFWQQIHQKIVDHVLLSILWNIFLRLGRLHTHRLFAGVGSGSGRGGFHTYRHYRCRRCFKQTEVFKSVVGHRQVQISVISRTKKMYVHRNRKRNLLVLLL